VLLLDNLIVVLIDRVRVTKIKAKANDVWGNRHGITAGSCAVWLHGIIPPNEHPDTEAPDYWTKYPFKIKTINNGTQYRCKMARVLR